MLNYIFQLLFFMFISCSSFVSSQVGDAKTPRLVSKDGNLQIFPGFNRNVSLEIFGENSCINVGHHNLLRVLDLAVNASNTVKRMYSSIISAEDSSLGRMNTRIGGIMRRLEALENGGMNSTVTSFYRNPTITLRSIKNRLRALDRKLSSLYVAYNTLSTIVNADPCLSTPCKNGGTCLTTLKGFSCICPINWEGTDCSIDVNECVEYAGTCLTCQNGGTCWNLPGSYECHCTLGWHGLHCTQRLVDCTSPEEMCGHGTCVTQKSGIKCICDPGWKVNSVNGACSLDVNECEDNRHPCSVNPHVPCINVPGSFYCGSCPAGYTGNGYTCTDIDECQSNNGGCSSVPFVQCMNTLGSRACGNCPPGYQGNGITCSFVGVCQVNNGGCSLMANCISNPAISPTYVQCQCRVGFTGNGFGDNGCHLLPPGVISPILDPTASPHCQINPCIHGTCHSLPTGHICICQPKYTGANCDQLINPCSSHPCKNGGSCIASTWHDESYKCICTNNFTGSHCDTPSTTCGGVLDSPEGNIQYPDSVSANYKHNSRCAWVIVTSPDKVLNVTFTKFNLEFSAECMYDWLQIHDGRNSAGHIIGRYCGRNLPKGGNIISTQNLLYLWFRSDHTVANEGFSLNWNSIDPLCGGEINNATYGIITSPGSPGKYPVNRDCYWLINAPINKRIQIHFFTLQIESHQDCTADYLEIRDGPLPTDNVLGQYCNTSHPPPLLVPGPTAYMHFHSDGQNTDFGFQISYAVTEGTTGCGVTYMQERGEIVPPKSEGVYVPNVLCEYKIILSPGTKIKITFVEFNLEESVTCNFDYVSVFDGDTTQAKLVGKYCGNVLPPTIISSSNTLLIVFSSDYTFQSEGFRILYEIVCHEVFTELTGVIKSPGYPKIYPSNRMCSYLIRVPPGRSIDLTFVDFDIEMLLKCTYDYLEIFDGDTENSTSLGKFCGTFENRPIAITSTHNYLYMKFLTDSTVSGAGFMANYSTIQFGCGGILTDSLGAIEYPDSSKASVYENNKECLWILSAPRGFVIQITWMTFELEELIYCHGDYVEVSDIDTSTDHVEVLGKFCGNNNPPLMTSLHNKVSIKFKSDKNVALSGFSLSYLFSDVRKMCGGTFLASYGVITSPNYPNNYPLRKDCSWIIRVPNGQQIMLNVTNFEMEVHVNCLSDYLEIRNGGTENAPLIGRYCGTSIPKSIPSLTNSMFIKFHSDISRSYSGFRISWDSTATGCGGSLTSYQGSIISPNYPNKYSHYAECYWRISTSQGSLIEFFFTDLDLEEQSQCSFDYVEVYDGVDGSLGRIGRYCSISMITSSFMSKTNHIFIKFRSDFYDAGRGFVLSYHTMCNRNLTGYYGVIESPNFPNLYPDHMSCEWTINAPRGNKINVTFSHFELEAGVNAVNSESAIDQNKMCAFDYVKMKDGKDVSYTKTYCGNELPPMFRSSDNVVFISFQSNNFLQLNGFRLEWVIDGCGGHLTHPTGVLELPRFNHLSEGEIECEWTIEVEQDKSIKLNILETVFDQLGHCVLDSLSVYNGPNIQSPRLLNICHSQKEAPQVVTSSGNFLFVKFVSESWNSKGLKATYKTMPGSCGGKFRSPQGSIHSPNYPNNYNDNMECFYLIQVPKAHRVKFTFTDFDLDADWVNSCKDVVKIYDGPEITSPLLGNFCGSVSSNNKTVISTTNQILVEFTSDSKMSAKGFKADYEMKCGYRITAKTDGILSTHEGLKAIYYIENCTWTIVADKPDQKIYLTITHLDTIEIINDICWSSALRVYNGDSINAPLIGSYCGRKIPPMIVSSGSALTLSLRVDSIYESYFSAYYSVLSTACGGTLTSEQGSFTSPSYPDPYPRNMECIWILSTSPGNKMSLSFTKFDLQSSDNCNEDFVEIREKNAAGKILGVFCGNTLPSNISVANQIWMKFRSYSDSNGGSFIAYYTYENVIELDGLSSGQISSPLYPLMYYHNTEFTWRITVTYSSFILITFKELFIDGFSNVCFASLTIYDGYDDEASVLVEICGITKPGPIQTSSNVAYVKFNTERKLHGSSFLLNWTEVVNSVNEFQPVKKTACGNSTVMKIPPGQSFVLQSPGYPNGYAHSLHCEWIFETDQSHHFRVFFKDVMLEESTDCFLDKITLFSGSKNVQDWKQIGNSICLSNSTQLSINSSNFLRVTFDSDMSMNKTGFEAMIYSDCGGTLEEPSGVITPVIPNLGVFPNMNLKAVECQWNIVVRPGSEIKVEFLQMSINNTDPNICLNYVMLRNGASIHSPLLGKGKYCGNVLPNETFRTTGNNLFINYHNTNRRNIYLPIYNPFILKYSEDKYNCGSDIKLSKLDNRTTISSPNYPNIPPPHSECTWIIMTDPGEKLKLEFIDRFDLTRDDSCESEYVEVRDGGTIYSKLIGRYCSKNPGTIKSTNNILFIKFFTDIADPRNGFNAQISLDICGGTIYGSSGVLNIPNTLSLSLMQKDIECEWRIVGSAEHTLSINLLDVVISDKQPPCGKSVLRLIDLVPVNDTELLLAEECGTITSKSYKFLSNVAILKLYLVKTSLSQFKFQVTFNSSKEHCGGVLKAPSGILEGPKYVSSRMLLRFCEWKITVPAGRRIKVEILSESEGNSTSQSPKLSFERLGFYNGLSYESLIKFISTNSDSKIVESSGNKMLVYYWSRATSKLITFKANYSSDEPSICEGSFSGDEGSLYSPTANVSSYFCEYEYDSGDEFKDKTIAMSFYDLEFDGRQKFRCRYLSSKISVIADKFGNLADICVNQTKPYVVLSPFPKTLIHAVQNINKVKFKMNYTVYNCGGVIKSVDDPDIFILPTNHTGPLDCAWSLRVQYFSNIMITAGSLVFSSQDCNSEYLNIRNGRLPSSALSTRVCYNRIFSEPLKLNSNIWIEYHADNYSSNTRLQFDISSSSKGCGGILSVYSKTFTSPNYPKSYGENQECTWDLVPDSGYRVNLSFEGRFFLEKSVNCTKDFVEISDYVSDQWVVIGRECGREMPKNYNSTSNKLKVMFRSDSQVNGDGFKARWNQFCGGTFTVTDKIERLTSPGFPIYGRNLSCIYKFITPEDSYINFNFTQFILEEGINQNCKFDNLTIQSETSMMFDVSPLVFCGSRSPGFKRMKAPVTITFSTDLWVQKLGFVAFFHLDRCGGSINTSQIIRLPSDSKNNYLQKLSCLWNITAPTNKSVLVTFRSFILEFSHNCDFDSISAYEGTEETDSKRLVHMCGNLTLSPPVIKSLGEHMLLRFQSDSSNELDGFVAEVSFTYSEVHGCGGTINLTDNTIVPLRIFNQQSKYEPFLDCHWVVKASPDNSVLLKFQSFNVSHCYNTIVNSSRKDIKCECDFIEIRDGPGFHSPLIGKFCGDSLPEMIMSTKNFVWIRFKTDGTSESSGISLTLSSKLSICGKNNFEVNSTVQVITSPGYESGTITKGVRCKWDFTTTKGAVIRIVDLDLQDVSPVTQRCQNDWLQISSETTEYEQTNVISGHLSPKSFSFFDALVSFRYSLCGNVPPFNIYTFVNNFRITLVTSYNSINHKGFKIEYFYPDCSMNYTALSGRLVDMSFHNSINCDSLILAPKNYTISLYIKSISLTIADCESSYVQIRDGMLPTSPIVKRICSLEKALSVYSTGNALKFEIHHHSDMLFLSYSIYYVMTDKGRGCGGDIYEYTGVVFSPMYPQPYRVNNVCEWTINSPIKTNMDLEFSVFDLGSSSCENNYLELIDANGVRLSKYCGSDNPATFHVLGNFVKVVYHSTKNTNGAGWILKFESIMDE